MHIDILVDFDNVPAADRRRGPTYIADRIFTAIGANALTDFNRASFRMYGGWYRHNRITRYGQSTAANVLHDFPSVFSLRNGKSPHRIVANAELAYSVNIKPNHHLFHTYRPRPGTGGIRCEAPAALGCTIQSCRTQDTHQLFSSGSCPEPTCNVDTDKMFKRDEQKLVDTMLVSDLIYAAHSGAEAVVIVSSDDDMWPGIITAVEMGMRVFHVNTRTPSRNTSFYTSRISNNYSSFTI